MSTRSRHGETMALAAGQPGAADYARALQEGVSWLRFEPPVEAEFQHSHVLRVRSQARFWQVFQIVVGLVAIQAILGGAVSENDTAFLLGCLVVHLAVSATLVAVAFGRRYTRS